MFGRCALRLCERLHLARKRGLLSRRSTAGCGSLAGRRRQVHAPCEAETGNTHERRCPKQPHRCSVLRYKGPRRKRLATQCCCPIVPINLRPAVPERLEAPPLDLFKEAKSAVDLTQAPKDANAPIFEIADYRVVADIFGSG